MSEMSADNEPAAAKYDETKLRSMNKRELTRLCKAHGIPGSKPMGKGKKSKPKSKEELIADLLKQTPLAETADENPVVQMVVQDPQLNDVDFLCQHLLTTDLVTNLSDGWPITWLRRLAIAANTCLARSVNELGIDGIIVVTKNSRAKTLNKEKCRGGPQLGFIPCVYFRDQANKDA